MRRIILITIIIIAVISLFILSCSYIDAGLYKKFINEDNDSGQVLANVSKTRNFLTTVLNEFDKFEISIYDRVPITNFKKKTELMTHTYYLFTNLIDKEVYTISFYGSKIAFYSEGAWMLNSNSDMASYLDFINGDNKWDVSKIIVEEGINTEETVRNIIQKIDEKVTYYYRDHVRKKRKPGEYNCNTILWETLVRKKNKTVIDN